MRGLQASASLCDGLRTVGERLPASVRTVFGRAERTPPACDVLRLPAHVAVAEPKKKPLSFIITKFAFGARRGGATSSGSNAEGTK